MAEARDNRGNANDVTDNVEAGNDIMPAVATGAVVALVSPGLLPGVAVGIGAMLLPRIAPSASRLLGNIVRPVVKTAVMTGYMAFGAVREVASEATEQVQDIVAEVQEEQRTAGASRSRRATSRKAAGAH